nr:MAG TPA: hypothetical protein [Caudoviricetes sp.]
MPNSIRSGLILDEKKTFINLDDSIFKIHTLTFNYSLYKPYRVLCDTFDKHLQDFLCPNHNIIFHNFRLLLQLVCHEGFAISFSTYVSYTLLFTMIKLLYGIFLGSCHNLNTPDGELMLRLWLTLLLVRRNVAFRCIKSRTWASKRILTSISSNSSIHQSQIH